MKRLRITLAAAVWLSGCAANGEIGFAHHPGDCAMGVGHSDCLPGTAGYARYQNEGNTVGRDVMTIMGSVPRSQYQPVPVPQQPFTCHSNTFGSQTTTTCQ